MSSFMKCLRNLFQQSTSPAETYSKPSATKYQFQPEDLDRLRDIMHPDDRARLEKEKQPKVAAPKISKKSERNRSR